MWNCNHNTPNSTDFALTLLSPFLTLTLTQQGSRELSEGGIVQGKLCVSRKLDCVTSVLWWCIVLLEGKHVSSIAAVY